MTRQPNQLDPIDRALSALRSAEPPAGMESRILQRLAGPQGAPSMRGHQEANGGDAFHSAWLRGALAGALAATAACAVLFFTLRPQHTVPQTVTSAATQHVPTATPVAIQTSDQCPRAPSIRDGHGADGWDEKSTHVPHLGSAWVGNATTDIHVPHSSRDSLRDEWEEKSHAPHLIPASFAPSRPAPPAPLTAQERALLQLVRTATPAQLAALSPAVQEKADADRQAAFQKFFAPSPEVLAIDEAQKKALGISDDEPAAPKSSKEGQL